MSLDSYSKLLTKKYLSLFILVIITLLLLFVGIRFFSFSSKNFDEVSHASSLSKNATTSSSLGKIDTTTTSKETGDLSAQTPSNIPKDTAALLTEVKSSLVPLFEEQEDAVQIGFHQNGGLWWINKDQFSIYDPTPTSLEIRYFKCNLSSEEMFGFSNLAVKLGETIDAVLVTNGFELNQENSSESVVDTQFYDYVKAYEKGSKKVTYTANPDCSSHTNIDYHYSFTLSISDTYELREEEQVEYLKDLKYGPELVIKNIKQTGDFLNYDVLGRRAGALGIAKKINGTWTEIYRTNGGPPDCTLVQRFNIPKEVVTHCFLEDNNLIEVK